MELRVGGAAFPTSALRRGHGGRAQKTKNIEMGLRRLLYSFPK